GLTVEFYDKESGYWIKPKGARNEPLDTVVYAIWASLAPAVKADVIRESQWEGLEQQFQPTSFELFEEQPETSSNKAFDTRPGQHKAPQRVLLRTPGFAREGWGL
ncbi:MAG: phage terminase large subunit family protein, partial [Cytophagaceae bacterium]